MWLKKCLVVKGGDDWGDGAFVDDAATTCSVQTGTARQKLRAKALCSTVQTFGMSSGPFARGQLSVPCLKPLSCTCHSPWEVSRECSDEPVFEPNGRCSGSRDLFRRPEVARKWRTAAALRHLRGRKCIALLLVSIPFKDHSLERRSCPAAPALTLLARAAKAFESARQLRVSRASPSAGGEPLRQLQRRLLPVGQHLPGLWLSEVGWVCMQELRGAAAAHG